jgi:hypothetical protein
LIHFSQFIFLQPDFSQNSSYLFQNNYNKNHFFYTFASKSPHSSRFCLFNFNYFRSFHFPCKELSFTFKDFRNLFPLFSPSDNNLTKFVPFDLFNYFGLKSFNFGWASEFGAQNLSRFFTSYFFPASMFVSSPNLYLNLSKTVKYVPRISTRSVFFNAKYFSNSINYTFNSLGNKYNRYRFYYFFSMRFSTNPEYFNSKFSCNLLKSCLPLLGGYNSLFQFLYVFRHYKIYSLAFNYRNEPSFSIYFFSAGLNLVSDFFLLVSKQTNPGRVSQFSRVSGSNSVLGLKNFLKVTAQYRSIRKAHIF